MELALIMIGGLLIAYAVVSRWIAGSMLTMPIVFVSAGVALGDGGFAIIDVTLDDEAIALIASLALALVLFSDASRIRLTSLRRYYRLPLRLLVVGLPLSIALGALAGWALGFGFVGAVVLATMVAPTDAALGQSVVEDPTVPRSVRQALNVESGLNDGLAVPLFLISIAAFEVAQFDADGSQLLAAVATQLGVAVIAGLVLGGGITMLLVQARRRQLASPAWHQIGVLALGLLCLLVADELGGSGFIAAFVGGMAYRQIDHDGDAHTELSDQASRIAQVASFFILGAVLAPALLPELTLAGLVFAVAALLVIRPLSVGLSLIGLSVQPRTTAFVAWFGPRGLATVVFIVLLSSELAAPPMEISAAATATVMLSVYLHGLTATPLARAFGRWCTVHAPEADPSAIEMHVAPDNRSR